MKTRRALLVIAFLPWLGINAIAATQTQTDMQRVLQEEWDVNNYPPILQLDQNELLQGKVNIEAELEKLASQARQRSVMELQKSSLLFEKPTGSKTVAVIGFLGDETWRENWSVDHTEVMVDFYRSIGIKDEDIYILGGRKEYIEVGQTGIGTVGPFIESSFIALINQLASNPEIKRCYISIHTHGGSYRKRIENTDGYHCTTPFVWEKDNPGHQKFRPVGYESEFEVGILRADNFFTVLKLSDKKVDYISVSTDPLIPRVKIWATEFVIDSDFSLNFNREMVAKIYRHRYYFNFCDSTGEVDWEDMPLESRNDELQADPDYINSYPSEIEFFSADYDRNGIADIPFAMLTSSGDTVLCVRMNLGNSYNHLSLTSDGMDIDGDGFIGSCAGEYLDINRNGHDDQLIIPTVFKLADGTLMLDVEFQQIFQQFNAEVEIVGIFHFCHAGGLLNYLPNSKSIFISSVDQFEESSVDVFLLDLFRQSVQVDEDFLLGDLNGDNSLTLLELANYTYSYRDESPSHNYYAKLILLSDNLNLYPVSGPWPNNGQGYLAQNFILTTSEQVSPVENEPEIMPERFSLSQNYPNPFNPSTTINYQVDKIDKVKLVVFNSLGQEIEILVDEQQLPGNYSIIWNATDFPSGIYFYQLVQGEQQETKRMIILK